MKKLNHTPGPWFVIRTGPKEGNKKFMTGAQYVSNEKKGVTGPVLKENARLIAAAPEMLEALIRSLKFEEKWLEAKGFSYSSDDLQFLFIKHYGEEIGEELYDEATNRLIAVEKATGYTWAELMEEEQ